MHSTVYAACHKCGAGFQPAMPRFVGAFFGNPPKNRSMARLKTRDPARLVAPLPFLAEDFLLSLKPVVQLPAVFPSAL